MLTFCCYFSLPVWFGSGVSRNDSTFRVTEKHTWCKKGSRTQKHVHIYIMYIYCPGSVFGLLSVGWLN